MDDPVQDRIRQGRILETPMPFRHGKLCRKQRGFVSKSIIHQIGETTCYFRADRLPEPVIYDKQIPCGEFSDKEALRSLGPTDAEFLEQLREMKVQTALPFTAGLLRQGACQIGFAAAGRSGDDQVMSSADPAAGGQFEEKPFV